MSLPTSRRTAATQLMPTTSRTPTSIIPRCSSLRHPQLPAETGYTPTEVHPRSRPVPMARLTTGWTSYLTRHLSGTIGLLGSPFPLAADLVAQEVEPLRKVDDAGLGFIECQPSPLQPPGQPRLDLFGLLPGVAAHDQVIGISRERRASDLHPPGIGAGLVAD